MKKIILLSFILFDFVRCDKSFLNAPAYYSTNSPDRTIFNRAIAFCTDLPIHTPYSIYDDNYSITIEFPSYLSINDTATYRKEIEGIEKKAFAAIYFDKITDTVFLKTHYLELDVSYDDNSYTKSYYNRLDNPLLR